MKGESTHEYILATLKESLVRRMVSVSTQVATRHGRDTGYVDLLAEGRGIRLAIEAEMTSRRVSNDLQKAADLEAWLWIVTPNARVANSVRSRLRRLGVREKLPSICVLTLGQALSRVAICFPLFSRS